MICLLPCRHALMAEVCSSSFPNDSALQFRSCL